MLVNLKTLRKQKGVSQQKLAEAIGVSQQSINRYENHNIEPDISTLIKIADFFDISIDTLVGRCKTEELNIAEQELVSGFRLLSFRQQSCVNDIISAFINS